MKTTFPEFDPNGRDLHRMPEAFKVNEKSHSPLGFRIAKKINVLSHDISILRARGLSTDTYSKVADNLHAQVLFYSALMITEETLLTRTIDNHEMQHIIEGATRIRNILDFDAAYEWLPQELTYGKWKDMVETAKRDLSLITNIKRGHVPLVVDRLLHQNKNFEKIIEEEIIPQHQSWFDGLKK